MSTGPHRKLTVRVAAQEASRRELQQALLAWEVAARLEGGVRDVHVYEDVLLPGVFGAEARLASAADLDRHLHSASFGTLLGALSILAHDVDLAICQPTQEFGTDAMAIVRRLRAQPAGNI